MSFARNRRRFVGAFVQVPTVLLAARMGMTGRTALARTSTRRTLTRRELASLTRMVYLLFPYPELGSGLYEQLAASIAKQASANADGLALLERGIEGLDQARTQPWLALEEGVQLETLRQIESGAFLQFVLEATRSRLFNDRRVWAHIGYEGSSLESGGYLHRGLNDINWLGPG